MQQRLGCTLILMAVIGIVGCAGDADSPAGSGLDPLSKIADQPKLADVGAEEASGPVNGWGHHGGGNGHHGGNETVACCFADGTCTDVLPHDCMDAGGMPAGMGTDCATTDCTAGGSTVACCFSDGTCTDMLPHDCMGAGGMPAGMGTDCATADCTAGGGGHGGGHHGGGG